MYFVRAQPCRDLGPPSLPLWGSPSVYGPAGPLSCETRAPVFLPDLRGGVYLPSLTHGPRGVLPLTLAGLLGSFWDKQS